MLSYVLMGNGHPAFLAVLKMNRHYSKSEHVLEICKINLIVIN